MTDAQSKGRQPDEAWVRKAVVKAPAFDVRREKETFLEARQDFANPESSVANKQHQQSQPQESSKG